MRFFDPKLQLLAMLYREIKAEASRADIAPWEVLRRHPFSLPADVDLYGISADAFSGLSDKKTPEESWVWLSECMHSYQETEASRCAEWKQVSEHSDLSVLDRFLEEDLQSVVRVVREDAQTLLLPYVMDESLMDGVRLTLVQTNATQGAQLLRSSMELSATLSDTYILRAVTQEGEVEIEFSAATRATEFYDYTKSMDAKTVLLPAPMRLAYRLQKLLQKALQPEETPLTTGELALLPLAIGSSFFYASVETVQMATVFRGGSACAFLRELENPWYTAVSALLEWAEKCQDQKVKKWFAPYCQKTLSMLPIRILRKFEKHIFSADGEKLCQTLHAELVRATEGYPTLPLWTEVGARLPDTQAAVDAAMAKMGYVGSWPQYRKEHKLSRARLFLTAGLYPFILPKGKRMLSMVECIPFLQGENLCVHFACGTILLKKKQDATQFLGCDSAHYAQIGVRRLQQFASGLTLQEDDAASFLLSPAETAVCAAKSAALEPLQKEERKRITFASRRPFWNILCYWFGIGVAMGCVTGLTVYLSRLAEVGGALWTAGITAGAIGLCMTIFTMICRGKL